MEQQDHYLHMLRPRFNEMVNDHRLYLGHREDRRQAHEKWRSWSWLGDPARLTDTEVQSWLEILSSIEPPVQCEGRGTEDEWKARGFERYASYFLAANSWTYTQEMVCRALSIQGWKVLKTGWREIKYAPMRRPTKEQLINWDEAVNAAMKSGLVTSPPDPLNQQPEFQSWLQSTQAVLPTFPAPPDIQPRETFSYRGPWIGREHSEFDLRFDPFTEDWRDQSLIFQRIVKPRAWGEKMVEKGKFDKGQFEKASRSGREDRRLSEWDARIAAEIGLTWDAADPVYQNSDEYWEVWRQFDETAPYLVILNRSAIVNVSTENPYWHRGHPYNCIRNTPMEHRAFGLGSYHQIRRTFYDRLTFRDLMLDMALLYAMPVIFKTRNIGIADLQRFLSPGALIDVPNPNDIRLGWGQGMSGFGEVTQVLQALLNDQNTQLATWDNVAGQSATVGRVSATESTSRLERALIKHKKRAERIEEEESRIFPQCMENAYQFYSQDPMLDQLRQQIVGEDMQDPLGSPEFTRETFGEDLAKNVRFYGATTKINKELQAQQIKDFLATFSQIQGTAGIPVPILAPVELRALARRAYEIIGQKGAPEVFTQAGDQAVQLSTQAYLQAAEGAPTAVQAQLTQIQSTIMQLQMQMQQLANPQPQPTQPGQAPPGNGQVPPEQQPQEAPVAQ